MSEPKAEDIDKQGGWLVRVKTPPALIRPFYVYEAAWPKALMLIKTKVPLMLERRSNQLAQRIPSP